MSDERDKKRINPYLESLSTEELEEMLMQDFMISGEDATEGLDIEEVVEVMLKREKKEPGYQPPDVNKAWAEFKEFYQDQALDEDLEKFVTDDSDISKKTESSPPKTVIPFASSRANGPHPPCRAPRKLHAVGRMALLIATITIISCGVASAFGFDIFQAVANWTSETFGFSRTVEEPRREDINSNRDFVSLRQIVASITDIPLVPQWASDQVEPLGEARITENADFIKISCDYLFSDSKREFNIRIRVYNDLPDEYPRVYQKDNNDVEELVVNGITHYLMKNIDNATATWTNGTAECVIQGDLTMEEMEQMVESIYEE